MGWVVLPVPVASFFEESFLMIINNMPLRPEAVAKANVRTFFSRRGINKPQKTTGNIQQVAKAAAAKPVAAKAATAHAADSKVPDAKKQATAQAAMSAADTSASMIEALDDIPLGNIRLLGPSQYVLNVGSKYVEYGATDEQGESIQGQGTVNTSMHGTYKIRYENKDVNGRVIGNATREVVVVEPPITNGDVVVLGANSESVGVGTTYVDRGAQTSEGTRILGTVEMNPFYVDTSTPRTYSLTYTAVKNGAYVTATRTVQVIASADPSDQQRQIDNAQPTGFIRENCYEGSKEWEDLEKLFIGIQKEDEHDWRVYAESSKANITKRFEGKTLQERENSQLCYMIFLELCRVIEQRRIKKLKGNLLDFKRKKTTLQVQQAQLKATIDVLNLASKEKDEVVRANKDAVAAAKQAEEGATVAKNQAEEAAQKQVEALERALGLARKEALQETQAKTAAQTAAAEAQKLEEQLRNALEKVRDQAKRDAGDAEKTVADLQAKAQVAAETAQAILTQTETQTAKALNTAHLDAQAKIEEAEAKSRADAEALKQAQAEAQAATAKAAQAQAYIEEVGAQSRADAESLKQAQAQAQTATAKADQAQAYIEEAEAKSITYADALKQAQAQVQAATVKAAQAQTQAETQALRLIKAKMKVLKTQNEKEALEEEYTTKVSSLRASRNFMERVAEASARDLKTRNATIQKLKAEASASDKKLKGKTRRAAAMIGEQKREIRELIALKTVVESQNEKLQQVAQDELLLSTKGYSQLLSVSTDLAVKIDDILQENLDYKERLGELEEEVVPKTLETLRASILPELFEQFNIIKQQLNTSAESNVLSFESLEDLQSFITQMQVLEYKSEEGSDDLERITSDVIKRMTLMAEGYEQFEVAIEVASGDELRKFELFEAPDAQYVDSSDGDISDDGDNEATP